MGEFMTNITNDIIHIRSLLDLCMEYGLSEQTDRSDRERLETIIFALEAARAGARGVETALLNHVP